MKLYNNLECDECEQFHPVVVELRDRGDSQIMICLECMKKAIELFASSGCNNAPAPSSCPKHGRHLPASTLITEYGPFLIGSVALGVGNEKT